MGESLGAGRWKCRTERHNQQYTNENRTANTKRVVCVPTCKGAVPGHAGGTGTRNLAGVTVIVEITRGLATT